MDPPKVEKRQDAEQGHQDPPELPNVEALRKRIYVWLHEWIDRRFGPRVARAFDVSVIGLVIFVLVLGSLVATLVYLGKLPDAVKSLELIPGASSIYNRLHPIPKADPARFSIALAHLQNDDGQNMEGFIARALKNFDRPLGIQFLQFDRTINLKDQSDTSERAGHEQARRYLKDSGAQALIWGSVWTINGKSEAQLYYTTAEAGVSSVQAYNPEDFKLPAVDRQELTELLGLRVATQFAGFMAENGSPNAGELVLLINKVQMLLNGAGSQDWNSGTRTSVNLLLGDALLAFGQQADSADALNAAAAIYRNELNHWDRKRLLLDWAVTQNNLGIALWSLGEEEANTTRLEQAVTAFHEVLKEFARERDPVFWAGTQLNLGNALWSLGKLESSTADIEQAVAAFREALKELTRERVPLGWATAQDNLGNALKALGEKESSKNLFEEAIAAHHEALKEFTRERVPLFWARAQNNLGSALVGLGERESSTIRLQEGVTAFREALKEQTRERAPLKWAMVQSNLGNAFAALGDTESNTTPFEEAVAAYREALKEQTRDRDPRDWAATEDHLGNALGTLGTRSSNRTLLEEALAAFREALIVRTRDRAPLDWAKLQYSIGNTLFALGELESNTTLLEQASVAFHEALKVQTRNHDPVDWAWTQFVLGGTLSALGYRKNNAAMICAGLGSFLVAWDVFSSTAAYRSAAPQAAQSARQDITMLRKLHQSVYPQCIDKYADILMRMNIGITG